MEYSLSTCFLLFFLYSVAGWIVEVTWVSIHQKKLVSRGFLIGPYLPIYGWGATLITLLLTRYADDIFVLFVMAFMLCCILEYLTSFIMEKLFNARWWDYSNQPFNVNGRVCLSNGVCFGLGGCFVILIANPIVFNLLSKIPTPTLNILAIVFASIFVIDTIVSTIVIIGFRKTTTSVHSDSTEEITSKVREILTSKGYLQRRLLNAFPNLEAGIQKITQKVNQMEREIRKLNVQKKKLTRDTERLIKEKAQLVKDKTQLIKDKLKNTSDDE